MQPDAFADLVVTLVKNALAPMQERLAAAESRLAVLSDVRDRLVTVETKAAQPALPLVEPMPSVDLSPVLERLAASEARLAVLGDLRDRLVTVETKAAQPVVLPAVEPVSPVDLSPVLERLAASEARLNVLGDLRDRVVVVETKAAQPAPVVDLGDVRERLVTVEADLKVARQPVPDAAPLLEKLDALGSEVSGLRERVAIAEMRQLVPGPPGRDGIPGRDGKDGIDGLGYDELGIEQQPDVRSVKFIAKRGLQVREFGALTIPFEMYRGVYVEGKQYERGDGVTYGGSDWHCNDTTTAKPGDGSKAWTLRVKRGRDGKDGRDAATLPVLSVKR